MPLLAILLLQLANVHVMELRKGRRGSDPELLDLSVFVLPAVFVPSSVCSSQYTPVLMPLGSATLPERSFNIIGACSHLCLPADATASLQDIFHVVPLLPYSPLRLCDVALMLATSILLGAPCTLILPCLTLSKTTPPHPTPKCLCLPRSTPSCTILHTSPTVRTAKLNTRTSIADPLHPPHVPRGLHLQYHRRPLRLRPQAPARLCLCLVDVWVPFPQVSNMLSRDGLARGCLLRASPLRQALPLSPHSQSHRRHGCGGGVHAALPPSTMRVQSVRSPRASGHARTCATFLAASSCTLPDFPSWVRGRRRQRSAGLPVPRGRTRSCAPRRSTK